MENILLVNPWICDFAAYDLWMRPVGLLRIAALLKVHGYNISYIDFLDRNHPRIKKSIRRDDFGCGKFYKRRIPRPEKLKDIPRPYFIYGLPQELAEEEVKNVPKPDFIFMTSGMTYWYPGLEYTAKFVKGKFPDVPIVLGGIYATLLPEHAKSLKEIDYVVTGSGFNRNAEIPGFQNGDECVTITPQSIEKISKKFSRCLTLRGSSMKETPCFSTGRFSDICSQLSAILGSKVESPTRYIYPEYSLLTDNSSLVIETSKGCPFNCSYCGSKFLNNRFIQREPKKVVDEIEFYRKNYGVKDIAFYDDALLINADKHIIPILDGISKKGIGVHPHTKGFPARQPACKILSGRDLAGGGVGINFHTPNGLHVRFIGKELAKKLKDANFKTITLSFETVNPVRQKNTGGKVTTEEFKAAVENLKSAGYKGKDIGVYLMFGMPHQDEKEVRKGIAFLHELKVRIILVSYSLVPNTKDEKMLKEEGVIDDNLDPLWHNDTIFSLLQNNFSLEIIKELRDYVSVINRKIG